MKYTKFGAQNKSEKLVQWEGVFKFIILKKGLYCSLYKKKQLSQICGLLC